MFCFHSVPANRRGTGDAGVKIKTGDDGLASSPRLSVTTSTGENSLDMPDLHIDPNTEQIKTAPDAGENSSINLKTGTEPVCSIEGVIESCVSDLTHLNERILQLQKKCIKLRKRFNKDICRGDKECMTNVDECKSLKTQIK